MVKFDLKMLFKPKMAKHTLKILRCSHRKILKVCLAILQHYA